MSDKNEAPLSKDMKGQAQSDSWKDAQKAVSASSAPKTPMHKVARKPDEFTPVPRTDKTPSGLELADESGAGGVAGFQVPMGIRQRKAKVDKLLKQHPDIGEGIALAYLGQLGEQDAEQVGNMLDMGDHVGVAEKMRMHAVRELVRNKVREVVRKKPGGGGYVLYAPNKGKKGKSKASGSFPTKAGAKRAELARFPPKDSKKLVRMRKHIQKLTKKPNADDRSKKAAPKKESFVSEAPLQQPKLGAMAPSPTSGQTRQDVRSFFGGLKTLQKGSPQYNSYVTSHAKLLDPSQPDSPFRKDVQKMDQMLAKAGKPTVTSMLTGAQDTRANAGFKPGQTKASALGTDKKIGEARLDVLHRAILTKVISRHLTEALFREENTESEWDEYISRLSKQALAGDGKFQNLQKNISRKTEDILDDAFTAIKRAVGKSVGLKSYGTKHDPQSGQSYLAFNAEFDEVDVGPIAIAVEGGLPKIHLSPDAKAALTKVDPAEAKMFRAELVTVQESVLDEMDDLAKATQTRDKYLQKLEGNVDAYVSGLSPLEVSVLKNLLTKKYRKIA